MDLGKRQLCVARSDWKGHVTVPKGGRLRYVPLTKRLADALGQARHLRGKRVLCDEQGHPLTQKVIQVMMRRVGKRANIKPGVHMEAAGVGLPRSSHSRMISRTRRAQSARNDRKPRCKVQNRYRRSAGVSSDSHAYRETVGCVSVVQRSPEPLPLLKEHAWKSIPSRRADVRRIPPLSRLLPPRGRSSLSLYSREEPSRARRILTTRAAVNA